MTGSPVLYPPLQQLAAHPDALVAVPFDPAEPYLAIGSADPLILTSTLRAMGKNPEHYWIGKARLAESEFVLDWDRTVSATFGAAC